jgi:DNA/RNA endonuclease G (NUC1)
MEKILLKSTSHHGKPVLEAIYDPDYSSRQGYDKDFLGLEVKLPVISNEALKKSIAVNNEPGRNGKNYLDYTRFSVLFNKDKKLPFLTAVNVDGRTNELAKEHEERDSDRWFQDARIKTGSDLFQYDDKDYLHSGFQKGHMVRYYDPAWGTDNTVKKKGIADTFHYTNCCPQIAKINTGSWNDLEDYYMAAAIHEHGKVTVFSGPVFNKARQHGNLLVPLHFWKVLVYVENKQLKAMGFLLTHQFALTEAMEKNFIRKGKIVQPTLDKNDIERLYEKLKQWVVKVEYIEEKTGISFGLNNFDVNKDREKYFNSNVIPAGEGPLHEQINRMKNIMNYDGFTKKQQEEEDKEFLQSL